MKRNVIKWLAILCTCTALSALGTACKSCGGNDSSSTDSSDSAFSVEYSESSVEEVQGIAFTTLTVNGDTVYGKVSNATTTFSFADELQTQGGATFTVASDSLGAQPCESTTVTLAEGDNLFYVLEKHGETVVHTYTVTLRRRPIYNVTFDTQGGTEIVAQEIEEDGFAELPEETPSREGYTFTDWNFDFSVPIVGATTVTAGWDINQYTLTVVYGNGQENKVITQDYNTTIENIAKPTEKDGYTFTGWDKVIPAVMPAENRTVTATWEAIFTLSDGTITGLTEHGQTLEALKIPQAIDGINVTAVGSYAFRNNAVLTSVWIDNGVTELRGYAFENCTQLSWVTLGDGLTKIADTAFLDCNVIRYNRKNGLQYLGSETNAYMYLMGVDNSQMQTVEIENTCKFIGKRAFYNCTNVTEVDIPDGVTAIGTEAFSGCASLSRVKLSGSITEISASTFYNCAKLSNVEIPDGVTKIGGSAFSGCAGITALALPASVTTVDGSAFYGCSNMESISFTGDSIAIDPWTFSSCENLRQIVLPLNVAVSSWGFALSGALTSVYYKGSADDWAEHVSLGDYNETLTDATRYYYVANEEDVPTDGGNYWYYGDNNEIVVW